MYDPQETQKKVSLLDRVLWALLGLLACIPLSGVLIEFFAEFDFMVFASLRLFLVAILAGASVAGLLLEWKKTIPFMILGALVMYLADGTLSSEAQDSVDNLLLPAIGAIVGLVIGLFLDFQ